MYKQNNKQIRYKLKQMRQKMDIPQNELSKRTGIAPSTIHRYETGDRLPNIQNAYVLAKFFGCSMEDMIEEIKDNPKEEYTE